jgi:hypothetical protein
MPYKDPQKQREAARRHYEKNRGQMIERSRLHKQKQRSKIGAMIRKAKDVPCVDCDVRYPYYVMDFDHVRGKKTSNLSAMMHRAVALKTVQAEIDKCDVVCANCHRERTQKQIAQRQALVG